MTRYARGYRIQAQTPWDTTRSVEEEPGLPADTQEVPYRCSKGDGCSHGGEFTRIFSAEAEIPDAVDCRCGGTGRLDSAPADAEADNPGYSQGVRTRLGTGQYKDMRPVALMMERRMRPDGGGIELLEETLAERLAILKGGAA